jgi:hypothetical protein
VRTGASAHRAAPNQAQTSSRFVDQHFDRGFELLQLPGHVARLLCHPVRSGWEVAWQKITRRKPISRKASTYKTPNQTLSTVMKPQVRTADLNPVGDGTRSGHQAYLLGYLHVRATQAFFCLVPLPYRATSTQKKSQL